MWVRQTEVRLLVFDRDLMVASSSTTVNIGGESYRLKAKKRAGVFTVPSTKAAT